MATINGAYVWQELSQPSNIRYDVLGKNSVAYTVGDPVKISSGVLDVAGTTDTVVGVAVKTQTMASTNQTVAKIYPGYIPADPTTIFLMGTNGDMTGNATDGGTFYKLTTATTNTVQVDQASGAQTGANRVVEIVKVDPYNVGGSGAGSGLRQVLVRFIKTPYSNIQITT